MRLSGGYKIWESIVKVDNGDQDLGATEGRIYIAVYGIRSSYNTQER